MSDILIFTCEGRDHEILLTADPRSATLSQLEDWLPAEVTIHCAKIAGCHIYWPSPILARLEEGTDIHALPPGSFLYYPDRQYLELIYDELQAETASVTPLGRLLGDLDWLREFATRQRREAGYRRFTASLRLKNVPEKPLLAPPGGDDAFSRIRRARLAAWRAQPEEVERLLDRAGHNIPFGPMMTADAYFRCVQESLWQLWSRPERFGDAATRAAAINAMELGIARIGHYCQMKESEAFLADAIACIETAEAPLPEVLAEVILYCSRMSNWIDLHIPWFDANETTKRALAQHGQARGKKP